MFYTNTYHTPKQAGAQNLLPARKKGEERAGATEDSTIFAFWDGVQ